MSNNKRLLTILVSCGLLLGGIKPTLAQNNQPTTPSILTEHKKPTHELLQLLALTNISHDDSFANILNATQKELPTGWLRAKNKQRWEIDEVFAEKHGELMHCFKQIGLVDAIKPQQMHYDYVFVLGATVHGVRARLAYLVELWQQGIRFDHIVLLGGKRKLFPNRETHEDLVNKDNGILPFKPGWQPPTQLPKTEHEMMVLVYEQSELPEQWQTIPVTAVDAPLRKNNNGTTSQSTTAEDTIGAWLALNPKPGTVLAISSQPFVGYQNAMLRSVIPDTFTVDTVGFALSKKITLAVILDSLTRWLYYEDKLK